MSVHFHDSHHTDHLNTPRLVADATGTTVWRHDNTEPFADSVPDEDPSSLGAFQFPLRFPGQYADKETGLHYNYFRDYDPSLGRYGESDPIGLKGGLNTYVYALDDPIRKVDPFGLDVPQMYPFVERMLQVPGRRLCECKSDRTGAPGEAIKNFMAGGAAAGGTTGLAYGIAHTGAHLGAAAGTGAVGAAGAAALGGKMAVTGLVLGTAGACIGIAVAGAIYFAPSMCLCEPEPIYFP